jgi:GNAT superfamily N-acetyltransferase
VFGGYFQGDLAGIATITRHPLLKRQHVAMLWGMCVQERYRGSGFAASILEVAITHDEAPFDQLELYVAVGNDHVATFTRELGDRPASRDAPSLPKGLGMRI